LKVRNTASAENAEKNQKPTHKRCVSCTSSILLHHLHNLVASVVHKVLDINCGLSGGSTMPYYKYEPQSVLENSELYTVLWKVHNNWSTVHNNRPDTVMFDKTIKQAYLTDAATPQPSQHTHRETPEVHRLERRANKNMTTDNSLYSTVSTIHNRYYYQ
jgi:hypothetical protein